MNHQLSNKWDPSNLNQLINFYFQKVLEMKRFAIKWKEDEWFIRRKKVRLYQRRKKRSISNKSLRQSTADGVEPKLDSMEKEPQKPKTLPFSLTNKLNQP